jgi:tight adherence protein C
MAAPNFFTILGGWAKKKSGGGFDDYLNSLQIKITAAGMESKTNSVQLLGIQLVSAVVFPVLVVFVIRYFGMFSFLFKGPAQILFYLALIAFGFYFPAMNIKERMSRRQKALILKLPDFVDLLTISIEAGLDFTGAMRRVVSKVDPGPLREEIERFFKQIELGRTRAEALRELATRNQLVDLSTICASMIQADRLGSPLGPILRVQSDMLRVRRSQRAEKTAMEAPVKMLAPLLLCIFPAVFIMLFSPIFIQMIQDLRGVR